MVWLPAVSGVVVVKVAVVTPAVVESVPVPRVAVPSLKVTVPVGFTAPDAFVTVAVKVTACPRALGLDDDASVVVVPVVPALTFMLIVLLPLLAKLPVLSLT